tara:strand:+ start:1861 stop:3687 length:1827 start_codon:yes stop_codon:yes gene_type:complete
MKKFNLKLTKITGDTDNKKENFYLGAWCLADMKKDTFNNLLINKYHWDDRKKLLKDYEGLNDYISSNFHIFSKYMAEITDAPNDKRYWKINLGLWLGYIIQILFDRWENIRTLPEFEFTLYHKPFHISSLRSNTVRDFFVDFRSDHWNEDVYRLILKAQNKKINYEKLNSNKFPPSFGKNDIQIIKNSNVKLKFKIHKFITKLIHKFYSPKYFIINSYLSRLDEIKLKLLLKEIPLNYKRSIYDPKINYKLQNNEIHKEKISEPINLRIDKDSSWCDRNKEFLIWFNEVLPHLIPCNYYINFSKFLSEMRALPFPKRPKVIFTSVLHIQHDYFNLYTSENIYEGCKYMIGQHGGGVRSMKICLLEDHQKEIADFYLTWGNDKLNDSSFPSKIFPVGNLKTSSKKTFAKQKIKNRILLLTIEMQRYSEVLTSSVISSQWLCYYKDLKKFIQKSIDLKIIDKIIVRNKLRKYGWNLENKLSSKFPNLKYDKELNYYKSVYTSSLVVSTYNGATYLETMTLNIPTIFFWDTAFWELNDSSIDDYKELIEVGIFHTNPHSAAEFINKIHSDINSWWSSEKVQIIREKFCKKFSKENLKLSDDIKKIIKNNVG